MELSRRLINAQEADRARLSRELHDDIGQSLAILKIQMLRCGQPESDHPGIVPADLNELAGRLDAIIHKVGRLSHDLHSSALEFLGLPGAVKGHCMECSERLDVPIQCCCQGVEKDLDKTAH
jgi:signal transduction histidine kinase